MTLIAGSMGQAIGDSPFGVAISPLPIVTVVLMLVTPQSVWSRLWSSEDATADARWYEADADSQEGTGSKGDEADKACGGEADTVTLATATRAGAASAALAHRALRLSPASPGKIATPLRSGRGGAAQQAGVRAHQATDRPSALPSRGLLLERFRARSAAVAPRGGSPLFSGASADLSFGV
jgi:hypothetical protein